MISVYRLVRAERADDVLSAEGARLYGGRWNPPGTPVVYASESRALAVLETFVHVTLEARFMRFLLYTLTLPARVRLTRHDPFRVPPLLAESRAVGEAWAAAGRTLALVVPSAIVGSEANFVLNARHERFARIRIGEPEPFSFDERLWRAGRR
ncbi:MAG TPA: RES family NAD+ phosphorylase [Gammaproteobacteria bacterium]|nr:RES family NAD+ phosphorylase [Gammaproteobacteria bacterium]